MLLRETEMKPGPQACIDTMSVEDAGHALIVAQEKAVRAVNSAMPTPASSRIGSGYAACGRGYKLCCGWQLWIDGAV
jgi:hypothetical protein